MAAPILAMEEAQKLRLPKKSEGAPVSAGTLLEEWRMKEKVVF